MRSAAFALAFALSLAACGGGSTGTDNPVDSGVVVTDTPVAAVDTPPAPPPPPPPADSGPPAQTYPAGPYGIAIGRTFEPFTLHSCNTNQDWHFDGPDFFESNLTVISIAAAWCVPCQRESSQIQSQIIERYAGMGVRFVQILVQNVDRTAISAGTCNAWVSRYGISFPELMDPTFLTSPYVPGNAFPGNVIVDRRGRIRWREYGSDTGLMSIRNAIDDVLAHPEL